MVLLQIFPNVVKLPGVDGLEGRPTCSLASVTIIVPWIKNHSSLEFSATAKQPSVESLFLSFRKPKFVYQPEHSVRDVSTRTELLRLTKRTKVT